MATPAAVLSIVVDANTTLATSKLSKFDRQLAATSDVAKKGIEARLGGSYNPQAFDRYEKALSTAARRARDREAFRAELGANFNSRAFNQYERAVDRANASTKSAEEHTHSLTRSLSGLAKAALAAGGAFVAFQAARDAVKSTAELAAATVKLSAITGLDTKTSSEWIEVMKARGVQTKATSMAFITLSRNVRTAQDADTAQVTKIKDLIAAQKLQRDALQKTGASHKQLAALELRQQAALDRLSGPATNKAVQAFTQLGVSQDTLRSKNTEEVLLRVAAGLGKITDPMRRAAIAQQLFGRGSQALIPILAQGRKGVEDLLASAQRYGAFLPKNVTTLRKAVEAQHQLNLAMDGLKISFTQEVFPALMKGADAVLHFIVQMRSGTGAGGVFAGMLGKLWQGVQKVAGVIGKLVNWIGQMVKQFNRANPIVVAAAGALAGLAISITAVSVALKAATAAQAIFNVVVDANIYVAAAVAIAAVAGALVLLYEKVKPVRNAINAVGHAISSAFRTAVRVATPFIKGLVTVIRNEFRMIRGIIEVFSGIFQGNFRKMWKGVKNIFSGWVGAIVGYLKGSVGTFYNLGKEIMHAVGHGLEDAAQWVINKMIDFANKLLSPVNAAIKGLNDLASLIPGVGSNTFGGGIHIAHANFAGSGKAGGASAAQILAAQGIGLPVLRTHGHTLGAFPATGRSTASHFAAGGAGGGGGGAGGGVGSAANTAKKNGDAAAKQHAAAVKQAAAAARQAAAAKAQAEAARKQAIYLAFFARIPSQGAKEQIKSAQIANRLTLATNAGNIGGQRSALNAERRLDKQWIAEDKRKLQKVNRQLARKGLSRSTRNALIQDKLGLIQEIGTVEADIGSVASSLQNLTGSGGTGSGTTGFDLAPGSVTLPTPYDVRTALKNTGAQHHHHGDVHVHVHNAHDVDKVADAIDRTMNSQIHSRLRRAGLRGT